MKPLLRTFGEEADAWAFVRFLRVHHAETSRARIDQKKLPKPDENGRIKVRSRAEIEREAYAIATVRPLKDHEHWHQVFVHPKFFELASAMHEAWIASTRYSVEVESVRHFRYGAGDGEYLRKSIADIGLHDDMRTVLEAARAAMKQRRPATTHTKAGPCHVLHYDLGPSGVVKCLKLGFLIATENNKHLEITPAGEEILIKEPVPR